MLLIILALFTLTKGNNTPSLAGTHPSTRNNFVTVYFLSAARPRLTHDVVTIFIQHFFFLPHLIYIALSAPPCSYISFFLFCFHSFYPLLYFSSLPSLILFFFIRLLIFEVRDESKGENGKERRDAREKDAIK